MKSKSAPPSEREKWGSIILDEGWTIVPNKLLMDQSKLGISPLQMCALLHMLRFWWDIKKPPFPSVEKTAKEIGVSENDLAEAIRSLGEKQLIQILDRGAGSKAYDLTVLRSKLVNESIEM
jgi:DNA replication protein DnaD